MEQWNLVPGLRRWKKDRKHLIRILLVMSLSFFLMEFTFLIGDSLEITLAERRKNAYGEWQFALLKQDAFQGQSHSLETNPFLEHYGYIWSRALLSKEDLDGCYYVGGIDADATEISRIQVLEGRFPEHTGEAAIEASLLKLLGVEGFLGERIELPLSPINEKGNLIKDEPVQHLTVTLCGILEDYNANWCISNRTLLPSIFLTEDSFAYWNTPGSQCLLLLGDPEWDIAEMEDDLNGKLADLPGTLVRNFYTYPRNSVSYAETILMVVRVLGGSLAAIILGITVITSVHSRREEWLNLIILGADRQRLKGLLFQEAMGFGLLSMIIGLGGALLGFLAVLPLSSLLLGFPLTVGFSLAHFLIAVGIGMGIILAAYLIPFLQMKRLTCLHQLPKIQKKGKRRRKGRDQGEVTFVTLWLRQWRAHPWLTLAQLLLICGILILPGIGIQSIMEPMDLLNSEIMRYGNSYTLSPTFSVPSAKDGISVETVKQLDLLYGISGYEAYGYTGDGADFYMNISPWTGNEYQNAAVENQLRWCQEKREREEDGRKLVEENKDHLTDSGYELIMQDYENTFAMLKEREAFSAQGMMITRILTVNSEKTLQPFLQNLDKGSVNLDDFFDGKSAILVLPALVESDNYFKKLYPTFPCLIKEQIDYDSEEGKRVIFENSISVGVSIPVYYQMENGEKKVQEVKIDGILQNIKMKDALTDYLGISLNSYDLICSEEFLKQFSWPMSNHYQALRVNASSEAGYGTDTQVARILSEASGMQYENHRESIEQLRQELYLDLISYGALCGLGMLLLLILLYGVSGNASRYQAEELEIMDFLGMKKSWKVFLQVSKTMLLGVVATGMAILCLSGINDMGFGVVKYLLLCVILLGICLKICLRTERNKH